MKKTWTSCVLAVALAACGPSKSPPVQMVVNVRTVGGAYQPQQVDIATLTDVVGMKGRVANLVGGARIVLDPNDPLFKNATGPLTDEQLANILLKNKGLNVSANYVEKDGILWPADFNTWNMASTYYNFEKAFLYFQSIGVPSDEMTTATVYYFPEYVDVSSGGNVPERTNALFYSPVQGFLILPFDPDPAKQEMVPLAMNGGIIGHEYSHRIWNKRVYAGQALPDPITAWDGAPLNLLKSIDEGFADWNGWGVTCQSLYGCDTRFVEASFGAPLADARDMKRNDKCITSGLLNQLAADTTTQFTSFGLQYTLGTIFASSLWHAQADLAGDPSVVQRALLASYDDLSVESPGFAQIIQANLNTPQNFNIPAVLRSILQHAPAQDVRRALCKQFQDRFQLTVDLLPECTSFESGVSCPPLQ